MGRPRVVNLQPVIVALPPVPDLVRSKLLLATPDFADTNGVEVWRLPERELTRLRQTVEKLAGGAVVSTARISTADEIQASLFCGYPVVIKGATNNVGAVVDCLPRVRGEATELTTAITLTEAVTNPVHNQVVSESEVVAVRTNLDLAARVQLSSGQGLFLLDAPSGTFQGRRFGIIMPVQVPPKK